MRINFRELSSKKNIQRTTFFSSALISCFGAFSTVACKPRSYNSSDGQTLSTSIRNCKAQNVDSSFPLISSPSQMTYTFHWTYGKEAETTEGAIGMVKKRLASVAKTPSAPTTNFKDSFGPGLYVASDPRTTRLFGDILLIVPVKPNCQFGYSRVGALSSIEGIAMVQSALAGIFYPYLASRALVVRAANAIEVDKIQAISFQASKKVSLSDILPLTIDKPLHWTKVLRHYGPNFPLLFLQNSETNRLKSLLSKIRSEQGGLTELGLAFVKWTEFLFPQMDQLSSLNNELKSSSGQAIFPRCYEETKEAMSFGRDGSEWYHSICYTNALGAVFASVFPEFKELVSQEPNVKEVNRTLVLGGILPKKWDPNTPMLDSASEILKNLRADQKFKIAAEHLLKAIDGMDQSDITPDKLLNAWQEPAIE